MIRNATRVFAALAAAVTGLGVAHAAPFQDVLVQPPSIGQPQRGSLAGSLSKLAFGAADLARGAYSLPLAVDVPELRGPLLAKVFPSYSAEGGLSEWGMGWGSELAIKRHRVLGDLQYDDSDGFTSPWGVLARGDDGDYYPGGLRSVVRAHPLGAGAADGWQVTGQDGTVYSFTRADAVTTASGTYAWMLSRVDSLLGDSTRLTWTRNDSGRAFLQSVSWGGRNDGTQYQASLVYELLGKPFVSYASGARQVLDRRVTRIAVKTKVGQTLSERWRYDLGYARSPLGPAFYLAQVTRTFASGQSEPPSTYDYDMGVEQLATATLSPQPGLDMFLLAAGSAALQPDHASMTDLEQNGLTDVEHYYSYTMVRQTEDGFVFEALPAKTGAENPLCRPDPSTLNKPRLLARMRGDLGDPQVVVVRKNGVGTSTTITLCDRLGMTQGTPATVGGNWELGASTRVADVDLDHRPDVVRAYNGGVQVLRNLSTSTQWSFLPLPAQVLTPAVSATASWVLDFNGDGKPDLMSRTSGGVLVWFGTGYGRFETTGKPFQFRTTAGVPLANLNEYQLSHGDFNGDGLTDVILSKAQSAFVYLNQGDEFQQRAVPGLASIPFSFGYPIVGDLTASGNPEVVFVDGAHARTIALSTASTGLLRRADDGKGTLVRFGYRRARPEPGIVYRYALLDSLTIDSSGYDPVTYRYAYAHPVWHSIGHYLVGFARTSKSSPFLSEDVTFHNDDDVAGVVEATGTRDQRTPGIEKFTANQFEAATYHGLPWRRQLAAETGMRGYDGASPLSTRVEYQAYQRGTCPVRVQTTLPGGQLVKEETLASVAALDDDLHCLGASQRLHGSHDDASLDFDYAIDIARNDLGQVTQVTQRGPAGPLVLQQASYDGNGRLLRTGSPGRGESVTSYDGQGRITAVTAADGSVIRVAAVDPLTDALREIQNDHGGGQVASYGYAFDGLERLQSSWNNYSGSSPGRPSQRLAYTFASAGRPGRVETSQLFDAAGGREREGAELQAADGEKLASAAWVGQWIVADVRQVDRNDLASYGYVRAPIGGHAALAALSWAELFGADASVVSQQKNAAFGHAATVQTLFQTGTSGTTTTSWERRGAELVVRTVQSGGGTREVGQDAAGRVVRSRDESGAEQRFVYDAMGRLVEVITPEARQRVRFDGYGRPGRIVRDGAATIEYAYDALTGLPSEKRVAGASGSIDHVTRTEHDGIGRVSHVEHVRPADGAHTDYWFDYDGTGAGPGGASVAGQKGWLSRVRGQLFERQQSFDVAGRLATTTVRLAGGWRELALTPRYAADGSIFSMTTTVRNAAGQVQLETVKTTQLDAHGRLERVLVDGVVLYSFVYDGVGRVERVDFADGHALVMSYDAATRARRGYHIEGPVQNGGVEWDVDQRGLIAGETFSAGLAGQVRANQRRYGYDARGFLVDATDDVDHARYSYSASGLPQTVEDVSGARTVQRQGATTLDVGGEVYRWDDAGRVVQRGQLQLGYGPGGQLEVASRPGRVARYYYDDAGQRVLKTVDGAPAAAYVGGGVLTEAAFIEPVVVEGISVGVMENGVFVPMLGDARGTPMLDEGGAAYLATPYGVRTARGSLAEVVDFARLGYDADLGTVRMGVRDYDPRLSQFWTPDPKFLEELDACVASPVECNLYGYARNNPLSFVDPRGTDSDPLPEKYKKSKMKKVEGHQLNEMDHTGTPISAKNTAKALLGALVEKYGTKQGDRAFAEVWPAVADYIKRIGSSQQRGVPEDRQIINYTSSPMIRIGVISITAAAGKQPRDTYRKSITIESSQSQSHRQGSNQGNGGETSGGETGEAGFEGGGLSVGTSVSSGWQDNWASGTSTEDELSASGSSSTTVDITVREEITHLNLAVSIVSNDGSTEITHVDLGNYLLFHQHNEAEDYPD